MLNKTISLILPMYDEIEYLPMALNAAKSVLETLTFDYEIIIVDDASKDGSGRLADDLAGSDKRIKVIHHNKNKKLGGALKTGFSNAVKDIIIYTDIDLPFDLSILKSMLTQEKEFDIIKGYRVNGRESLIRVIYSKVYNFMIRVLFQLKTKDINFALKIFKREVLNEVDLKSEGSFINAEFLAKAVRSGFSISEVGVEYVPRTYGVSRLSSLSVIFKIIYETIKFYPEIIFFSYNKAIYSRMRKLHKKINVASRAYDFVRFYTCPFVEIKKFVPQEGTIVDLGCGTGIFLNMLGINSSNNTQLIGFDKDRKKLKLAAESVNANSKIKFLEGDIGNDDFNPPGAKCFTFIDSLYYLAPKQKIKVLSKCFNALDEGGMIIIKDIAKAFNLKFIWLYLQEFIMVKVLRFTSGSGLYFENARQQAALLEKVGFSVKMFDLSKGYLYPHIMYVAYK